jgi:hypothetical protein
MGRVPLSAGAASLLVVFCGACGYRGDPLPPALNIASPVANLRAVEYGDRLIVGFTIPPLTTEGLTLTRIGTVELRVGPGSTPFDTNRWAASAREIPVKVEKTGPFNTTISAADWVGKEIILAVRVVNPKGRASAWSNLAVVNVLPPVPAPSSVAAESAPQGARVRWQSPLGSFRVFRLGPNEKQPALLATVETPEYVDATAQFGTTYSYRVQALHDKAESVISEPYTMTPVDTFPPVSPSGLSGVPGVGAIELLWDRNTEPDLRGYRVYRAAESGQFERLAEFVDAPAYSDRQIDAGKKYRYAVTAIDQAGNESAKSAAVEVTAP